MTLDEEIKAITNLLLWLAHRENGDSGNSDSGNSGNDNHNADNNTTNDAPSPQRNAT